MGFGFVEGYFQCVIGVYVFVEFMNVFIKQFWFYDFFGEDLWLGLIIDFQCIVEVVGDEQCCVFVFVFQQCVGGNCCFYFNCCDFVGRNWSVCFNVE